MATSNLCIGYARISTDRKTQTDTLEAQKKKIQEYANANNYQLEKDSKLLSTDNKNNIERSIAIISDLKVLRHLVRLTLDVFIYYITSSIENLAKQLALKDVIADKQASQSDDCNNNPEISEKYKFYHNILTAQLSKLIFAKSDLGQEYTHLLLLSISSSETLYNNMMENSKDGYPEDIYFNLRKLERKLRNSKNTERFK